MPKDRLFRRTLCDKKNETRWMDYMKDIRCNCFFFAYAQTECRLCWMIEKYENNFLAVSSYSPHEKGVKKKLYKEKGKKRIKIYRSKLPNVFILKLFKYFATF